MHAILKLFTFFAVLFLLGSCKKQSTGYDPYAHKNDHFTATFNNYWAPGEQGVAIFLSDPTGKTLSEQLLHGQSEVTLYPQTTVLFPDTLNVTLIYTGPSSGNRIPVYMYTYLNVPISDWIYRSWQNIPVGNATFQFTGIPQNKKYSLSDYYEWTYGEISFGAGDTLQSQYTLALNRSPDNCYLWLTTTGGEYKYKWIQGITSGGSYPVNLSGMDAPSSKTVNLPPVTWYTFRFSGYLPAGEHSTGLYTLDHSDYTGGYVNNLSLHYPPSLFTDYQLYIYYHDKVEPQKEWYTYTFGAIPGSISKIDGDVQIVDSTASHFNATATGTFDRMASNWAYDPSGSSTYRYEWHIFSKSSQGPLVFPLLPPDVAVTFQGFTADSLTLSNVEIKDFDRIYSYSDYIYKVFNEGRYIANIVGQYSGLVCYPHALPSLTGKNGNNQRFD